MILNTRYGPIELADRVDSDGHLEVNFVDSMTKDVASRWFSREEAIEVINHLSRVFDVNLAPEGSGSYKQRLEHLLEELELRFPDPNPYGSAPPESRYLKAIDATSDRELIEFHLLTELELDRVLEPETNE